MEGLMTALFVVLVIFAIGTFFSGLFTVPTAKAAVVQRFGRFVRVAGAGVNFKLPWIEQVVANAPRSANDGPRRPRPGTR